MARLQFRLTAIALDEEEDVREVTAVVRDDTHRLITSLVGDVTTISNARGGTELTIALPRGRGHPRRRPPLRRRRPRHLRQPDRRRLWTARRIAARQDPRKEPS